MRSWPRGCTSDDVVVAAVVAVVDVIGADIDVIVAGDPDIVACAAANCVASSASCILNKFELENVSAIVVG